MCCPWKCLWLGWKNGSTYFLKSCSRDQDKLWATNSLRYKGGKTNFLWTQQSRASEADEVIKIIFADQSPWSHSQTHLQVTHEWLPWFFMYIKSAQSQKKTTFNVLNCTLQIYSGTKLLNSYVVLEPDPRKIRNRVWEIGWGGSVLCAWNASALPIGSWLHAYKH